VIASKKQATRATPSPTPEIQKIIDACAATADDLKATRTYASNLESENKLLSERLETEKKTTAILTELNKTREAENAALRDTVMAKNETIAAKDAVITAQDKLVAKLQKNKSSPWQRAADVLLGVGLFALLR